MHHGILLKVHGNSKQDAQGQADNIMRKTLRCDQCESSRQNINWDYFQFVAEVDEKWIKENRSDRKGVKTVQDLIEHYIRMRQDVEKRYTKKVVGEIETYEREYKKSKKLPCFSMLSFYLRELDAIQNVIEYGDADDGLYTLHCTNNHYADMTKYTEGDKVFYFWYDRHY